MQHVSAAEVTYSRMDGKIKRQTMYI